MIHRDHVERSRAPKFVDPAGKPPPHDITAERDLVANVIEHPRKFDEASEIVDAKHFYDPFNRVVWRQIVENIDTGIDVTLRQIQRALLDADTFDEKSSLELAQLVREAPYDSFPGALARRIRDKWRLREATRIAWETLSAAYGDPGEPQAFLDRTEVAFCELALDTPTNTPTQADDVREACLRITSSDPPALVASGIEPIDKQLGGLFANDLMIVGARPNVGKTALMMEIATNVGLTVDPSDGLRNGVVVFSLEMSRGELIERSMCARAAVDFDRMRKKLLNDDERRAMLRGGDEVTRAFVHTDDSTGLSPRAVRAISRAQNARWRARGEGKLALICIDFLQELDGRSLAGERADERQQISAIVPYLKGIAKKLAVPVLVLSALTRPEKGERPNETNLKGSSIIESKADQIWILHREVSRNDDGQNRIEVDFPKSRHGASKRRVFLRLDRGRVVGWDQRASVPLPARDHVDGAGGFVDGEGWDPNRRWMDS